MKRPLVSTIITTKNEESVLERLLVSLAKQSYSPIEVIVVDNNSTDRTKKIARRFTQKVFNYGPERSAQRNFGAYKAKGEYLLFLDADMQLSTGVISECIDVMERDKKNGAIAIPEESVALTFWERVKAFERSFYNKYGDPTTDAARFFLRGTFYKAGKYDESITGPEDWDLPERILKAGYQQARIKSVILHYERVPDPFKLAKKKYYYALTSYRYLKKHNISALSDKTVYFLRPVFYRNWKKILLHPILSISMFIMLTFEQIGGGIGYIVGRYKNL